MDKLKMSKKSKLKILIIEDEIAFRLKLENIVQGLFSQRGIGILVFCARNREEASRLLTTHHFDLGFIDIYLGKDKAGIEILEQFNSKIVYPVVVSSAFEDKKLVGDAYKNNAQSFLRKPFNENSINDVVNEYTHSTNNGKFRDFINMNFITQDEETLKELEKIMHFKLGSKPVHLFGETGTGKRIIANLIHKYNFKNEEPFRTLTCSNLNKELFESTLFGHVKGSFTGASQDKKGEALLANGGTLFLDEIDKIPMEIQDKFLEFVETQEFSPVGSEKKIKVNLLIVSAASQDLSKLVDAGLVRRDLKARLAQNYLKIKPLRERKKDISVLIDHFMYSHEKGTVLHITEKAHELIENYSWPENVRELEAFIDSFLSANKKTIRVNHIQHMIEKDLNSKYEILNKSLVAQIDDEQNIDVFVNKLMCEAVDYYYNRTRIDSKNYKGHHQLAINKLGLSRRRYYKFMNLNKEFNGQRQEVSNVKRN